MLKVQEDHFLVALVLGLCLLRTKLITSRAKLLESLFLIILFGDLPELLQIVFSIAPDHINILGCIVHPLVGHQSIPFAGRFLKFGHEFVIHLDRSIIISGIVPNRSEVDGCK